jgi:glycerol-3-phosphate dehydrogenase
MGSLMNRSEFLARLDSGEAFDVAIVGGGATGLGIAVDAASRGCRTVLVEQDDFAKATSSRSTKLIHGGVRYLKQGNVGLVLEALHEREILCRNAPHLVRAIPFVIPVYRWWEGPFYGVGMKLYDAMAGRLGITPSRMLSKEETLERIPTIERKHLLGGVEYHDGQFDDARLAIHLAMTAAEHGAVVLNYMMCTGFLRAANTLSGIRVRDVETGMEREIHARVVINATGVFADTLRKADDKSVRSVIAASQGIHVVLPREFLPGDSAIMIPKTADGRVLFAVPWHGCVVVGTTDTPVDSITLEPRALGEEKEFILSHAVRYLSRDPAPSDVLSVFAGLRPLVRTASTKRTASLPRDHVVEISKSGLVTVMGGKWTTYRRMAQDAVDQALSIAGLPHVPCKTNELPIHGAATPGASALASSYGSDAEEVARRTVEAGAAVCPGVSLSEGEVRWYVEAEGARTVEDVLARRRRLLLTDARKSIEAAPRVASILAKALGRSKEWEEDQVRKYRETATGYLWE